MKILITGIAGFLGSHLGERLLKDKHRVFGVDNFIGGYPSNIPKGSVFYEGDLTDYERVKEIMAEVKPDIIYHCACTPYEGLSVFSPALVVNNTVTPTVNLLSLAAQYKPKRFVYLSSMSRYGKQKAPFTEDMPTAPEDPYAIAKVASEQLVKQLAETHGFEWVIAVPHNIIGPRQKYDDPFRNVASIFLNRMFQGKPPIIYGDGKQTRSFSFVDDCLTSLVRMIDCKQGIYNIGPDEKDGELCTINELAKVCAQVTGFKGKPIYMPDRPREVKEAHCSSDKIRKQFGYKTETKLIDGIRQMAELIQPKKFDYHLPIEIRTKLTPKTWTKKLM